MELTLEKYAPVQMCVGGHTHTLPALSWEQTH